MENGAINRRETKKKLEDILRKKYPFFSLLFALASCGPSTLSDIRYEGEAETRKLAEELRMIETKEELQKAIPKLRKQFNRIADLLIEAKGFPKEDLEPSLASEELFTGLARLYEIPGGRELVESAQVDAVQKLKKYY